MEYRPMSFPVTPGQYQVVFRIEREGKKPYHQREDVVCFVEGNVGFIPCVIYGKEVVSAYLASDLGEFRHLERNENTESQVIIAPPGVYEMVYKHHEFSGEEGFFRAPVVAFHWDGYKLKPISHIETDEMMPEDTGTNYCGLVLAGEKSYAEKEYEKEADDTL